MCERAYCQCVLCVCILATSVAVPLGLVCERDARCALHAHAYRHRNLNCSATGNKRQPARHTNRSSARAKLAGVAALCVAVKHNRYRFSLAMRRFLSPARPLGGQLDKDGPAIVEEREEKQRKRAQLKAPLSYNETIMPPSLLWPLSLLVGGRPAPSNGAAGRPNKQPHSPRAAPAGCTTCCSGLCPAGLHCRPGVNGVDPCGVGHCGGAASGSGRSSGVTAGEVEERGGAAGRLLAGRKSCTRGWRESAVGERRAAVSGRGASAPRGVCSVCSACIVFSAVRGAVLGPRTRRPARIQRLHCTPLQLCLAEAGLAVELSVGTS